MRDDAFNSLVSGVLESGATITARRILEVARKFGASAEKRGLRDTQQGGGRPGIAGDSGLDLGQ